MLLKPGDSEGCVSEQKTPMITHTFGKFGDDVALLSITAATLVVCDNDMDTIGVKLRGEGVRQ